MALGNMVNDLGWSILDTPIQKAVLEFYDGTPGGGTGAGEGAGGGDAVANVTKTISKGLGMMADLAGAVSKAGAGGNSATNNAKPPTGRMVCWFNPTEYTISRSVNCKDVGGIGQEAQEAATCEQGPKQSVLSVSIFLDKKTDMYGTFANFGKKAKNKVLKKEKTYDVLHTCQMLEHYSHRNAAGLLPKVGFKWGGVNFVGHLTSITIHYTMFERNGEPSRAKVDLQIKGKDRFFKGSWADSKGALKIDESAIRKKTTGFSQIQNLRKQI